MDRMERLAYAGDVIALCLVDTQLDGCPELVLAGLGSQLHVYDHHSSRRLQCHAVFDGVRVHGISVQPCTSASTSDGGSSGSMWHLVVHGGRYVKVLLMRVTCETTAQRQDGGRSSHVRVSIAPLVSTGPLPHWTMHVAIRPPNCPASPPPALPPVPHGPGDAAATAAAAYAATAAAAGPGVGAAAITPLEFAVGLSDNSVVFFHLPPGTERTTYTAASNNVGPAAAAAPCSSAAGANGRPAADDEDDSGSKLLLRCLGQVGCTTRCLLYSMDLGLLPPPPLSQHASGTSSSDGSAGVVGDGGRSVHDNGCSSGSSDVWVAAGTVFLDVLVWKVPGRCWGGGVERASGPIAPLFRLVGHQGSIHRVRWAPGCSRLASGSDDRSVRVWDLPPVPGAPNAQRQQQEQHGSISGFSSRPKKEYSGSCGSCSHSPSAAGSEGATAAAAAAVAAPEPAGPMELEAAAVLFGHTGRIWECRFWGPGQDLLLTGGEDCTCRVWGGSKTSPNRCRSSRGSEEQLGKEEDGEPDGDGAVKDGSGGGGGRAAGYTQLAVLQGHGGRGVWQCLPARGLRVITAGADSSIKVWHLPDYLPRGVLATYPSVVPYPSIVSSPTAVKGGTGSRGDTATGGKDSGDGSGGRSWCPPTQELFLPQVPHAGRLLGAKAVDGNGHTAAASEPCLAATARFKDSRCEFVRAICLPSLAGLYAATNWGHLYRCPVPEEPCSSSSNGSQASPWTKVLSLQPPSPITLSTALPHSLAPCCCPCPTVIAGDHHATGQSSSSSSTTTTTSSASGHHQRHSPQQQQQQVEVLALGTNDGRVLVVVVRPNPDGTVGTVHVCSWQAYANRPVLRVCVPASLAAHGLVVTGSTEPGLKLWRLGGGSSAETGQRGGLTAQQQQQQQQQQADSGAGNPYAKVAPADDSAAAAAAATAGESVAAAAVASGIGGESPTAAAAAAAAVVASDIGGVLPTAAAVAAAAAAVASGIGVESPTAAAAGATLVAEGRFPFEGRLQAMDACPSTRLMVCGTHKGDVAALAWAEGGRVDNILSPPPPSSPCTAGGTAANVSTKGGDDATRPIAAACSSTRRANGIVAAGMEGEAREEVEQLRFVERLGGVHGSSAVGLVHFERVGEVVTCGREHELKTFRYYPVEYDTADSGGGGGALRLVRLQRVSPITGVELDWREDGGEGGGERLLAGHEHAEYVVYSYAHQAELMRAPCVGWQRPHSAFVAGPGDFVFAYLAEGGRVRLRRRTSTAAAAPSGAWSLHLSHAVREVNDVAVLAMQDGTSGPPLMVVVTGSESGGGLDALVLGAEGMMPSTQPLVPLAGSAAVAATGAAQRGAFAAAFRLGEHLAGTSVKAIAPLQLQQGQHRSLGGAGAGQLLVTAGSKEVLMVWRLEAERQQQEDKATQQQQQHGYGRTQRTTTAVHATLLAGRPPPASGLRPKRVWRAAGGAARKVGDHRYLALAAFAATRTKDAAGQLSKQQQQQQGRQQQQRDQQRQQGAGSSADASVGGSDVDDDDLVVFMVAAAADGLLQLLACDVAAQNWCVLACLDHHTSPTMAVCMLPPFDGSNDAADAADVPACTAPAPASDPASGSGSNPASEPASVLASDCPSVPASTPASDPGARIVFSGATDGSIAVWDVGPAAADFTSQRDRQHRAGGSSGEGDARGTAQEQRRGLQGLRPLLAVPGVHQSAVNALSAARLRDGSWLLASGGDDQALALLRLVPTWGATAGVSASVSASASASARGSAAAAIAGFSASGSGSSSAAAAAAGNSSAGNSGGLVRVHVAGRWLLRNAHSSALRAVWTNGRSVLSTGLDQVLRAWAMRPLSLLDAAASAPLQAVFAPLDGAGGHASACNTSSANPLLQQQQQGKEGGEPLHTSVGPAAGGAAACDGYAVLEEVASCVTQVLEPACLSVEGHMQEGAGGGTSALLVAVAGRGVELLSLPVVKDV